MVVSSIPFRKSDRDLRDIFERVSGDSRFTALTELLRAAGLDSVLCEEGPFTLLAPTDEAFAQLADGAVRRLIRELPGLKGLLLSHVLRGRLTASQALERKRVTAMSGVEVAFTAKDGKMLANNAVVAITDIEASNGVVHVLKEILDPAM